PTPARYFDNEGDAIWARRGRKPEWCVCPARNRGIAATTRQKSTLCGRSSLGTQGAISQTGENQADDSCVRLLDVTVQGRRRSNVGAWRRCPPCRAAAQRCVGDRTPDPGA